ncbi:MAG: hypothetical protein MJ025_06915 [Victivallaceae bacterium]|nr:hypothetical protein [Victivallaceae bacterium]
MTARFIGLVVAVALLVSGCSGKQEKELLSSARAAAAAGNWQQAESDAAKVLELAPDNVIALLIASSAAEKRDDLDEATNRAGHAARVAPNNFTALYMYGRLLYRDSAQKQKAIEVLEKAHNLRPDDPDVLVLLCNLTAGTKDPNAEKYLREYGKLGFANSPEYLNQLGVCLWLKRDVIGARSVFAKARQTGSDRPMIMLSSARFFDACNMKPLAVDTYGKFVKMTSNRNEFAPYRAEASQRISALRK